MNQLTHFDQNGNAVMVDVSEKNITTRIAIARGTICVNDVVIETINQGTNKKGDVLGVARVAGIMAVKNTAQTIPMCHPLLIQKCSVDFTIEKNKIMVECMVKIEGKTGVEMEALHGASVSLLTIYDMCKAVDKAMVITNLHVVEKLGGRSGHYKREYQE